MMSGACVRGLKAHHVDRGLWTASWTRVSITGVPPRADPHPALKRLGQRIRELRVAKNWTQEDLAGESGLDRSYVSGLEVGRRNPTYLNLLKIAKTFGISLLALLDVAATARR
jgi:ribosome-binding protein aMBF1 (putative translation factor)